jgi:CP family cyanate transporter-like MFS transporter
VGGGFTLGMTLPLDNTHDSEGADSWNASVMTIGYLIAAGGPLLGGGVARCHGQLSRIKASAIYTTCAVSIHLDS